ncbi:histone deacetylase complex subunit SAP130-like isoform X1 [Leucoraja erinacea]|uniref:histone deacetylase complex subunit SAP130-like isoform X1 n=1 Tax=Leucoraja erinaceus TaxID=7782 RepID=UPI002458ED24|nr:histone deacetylase complex subunit SAP130-like isoform X1 [Leucoraja erinacea]XP_055501945.1 histone deacetylase complex subunit SAP130-like isoform X1 [Leucoraja erinacea]XP_055501946.1 histone deacetylase complex subunit SAP130-like isoform X1 [Leucoraja erinacea]
MSTQQFPRPGVSSSSLGAGQTSITSMQNTSGPVAPGNSITGAVSTEFVRSFHDQRVFSGCSGVHPTLQRRTAASEEMNRDLEHLPREHSNTISSLPFRDEKQETVVVRPYPQVQAHAQPLATAQHHMQQPGVPVTMGAPPTHLAQATQLTFPEGLMKTTLKSPLPSRPIAPAPSGLGHLTVPPKVSGHVTVSMDPSVPQASAIPVATISGQQGHPNIPHLMGTNVQMSIIRNSVPASLHIGPSTAQTHMFSSHVPRGAAVAAAISSSKVTTVLRPAPAPLPTAGNPQTAVQHSLHLPIQSRPPPTTSTAIPSAVVATVSATRAQSPVIPAATAHGADVAHSRPALTIQPHPSAATISIQRTQQSRDTTTRITLPSHPAVAGQKPQLHPITQVINVVGSIRTVPLTASNTNKQVLFQQKAMFSTGTPVAAATVAPILSTNSIPSTTGQGAVSHAQVTSSTIVNMTMASHTPHAPVVTTSTIPVAKVVPQPITHTSPRIQPDYTERGNLISIPGHRASPNPVTMETRTENRQVPVQFQYYLPAYPPSAAIPGYPTLAHTFTPITSTVSTIRQYPVSAQAPSSVSAAAIAAQAGVGVASTVHLNPMQLMTVDATHTRHIQGLQPASITAQGLQPTSFGPQGIQPSPLGAQGIQSSALGTQALQPASLGSQQTSDNKPPAVMLTDGATIIANPISTFSATPAVTTVIQTHTPSSSTTALTQGSSPRPSILRKKPASDGMAVRKSLIPPQPTEATSPRLDGTMRNASGSPRPVGPKSKPEIHVSITTPVAVAMEAISNQNMEPMPLSGQPNSQQPPPPIPTLIAAATPHPQPTSLSTVTAAVSTTTPISVSMTTVVAPPSQPVAISVPVSMSSTLPEIKIKRENESVDALPVSISTSQSMSVSSPALIPMVNNLNLPGNELPLGASPRKKPRKQQHIISTEESEMMETNSTDEEKNSSSKPVLLKAEKRKSPPKEYIDEEGVRYVPVRPRPPVTLLRHYRNPWKAAYHHFQRYSDVKVKEEKKPTLQEIANQKGIVCKAQGWKVHLCAAQLMQLTSLEHDVYNRLASLQDGLIPKKKAAADDDMHRINELIQGNMQRCKLVIDQITEAKDTMMKVLDHKDRVLKLLNKNGAVKKVSKLKRKEKS